MIIRIVKMTFREGCSDAFLRLFDQYKNQIAGFPNCISVELLRDENHPNIFFTYSKWQNEKDLQRYRNSDLFKEVWSEAKMLFSDKAEAWSVNRVG